MNESHLIFYAAIIFCIYALYKGIVGTLYLSKKLPVEIKKQYKTRVIFKSLFLNPKYWASDISEKHKNLFSEINIFWQKHIKQLLVAWGILILVLFIAVAPSIIYLIKN